MPTDAPNDPWWVDAHLDLAYLDLMGPAVEADHPTPAARGVSLPALVRGGVRIALGTIFTEFGSGGAAWGYVDHDDLEGAHAAGVRQLERYEAFERAGRIRIVRTRADLETCMQPGGAPGIVILMECADPIRTPEEAAWWHARGVRAVGLSWAHGSRWAGGNARAGGLTTGGRALVQALDALGVLHDASHLSDAAFDDLCAATDRRIVATHSNMRALMDPRERHLTDAQVSEIARRDGVVGLNLYGKFLARDRAATLDDAIAHVEHAAAIAGRTGVGLGSDFDGVPCVPQGIDDVTFLPRITYELLAAGQSEETVKKVLGGNLLRVLAQVEQTAQSLAGEPAWQNDAATDSQPIAR
jgi:membrane dipeptidase